MSSARLPISSTVRLSFAAYAMSRSSGAHVSGSDAPRLVLAAAGGGAVVSRFVPDNSVFGIFFLESNFLVLLLLKIDIALTRLSGTMSGTFWRFASRCFALRSRSYWRLSNSDPLDVVFLESVASNMAASSSALSRDNPWDKSRRIMSTTGVLLSVMCPGLRGSFSASLLRHKGVDRGPGGGIIGLNRERYRADG